MARYIYQGFTQDQNGKVVPSATMSVYLAGTTTAASIYTAASGGTAVNSVTSSSTNGSFSFYVDANDYGTEQKFKITMTKADFLSQSLDGVVIFPSPYVINVMDFGATGDGATDDTVAIQTAITAGSGKTVWFPKPSSRYKITDAITLPSAGNIKITGDGWPEINQATSYKQVFVLPDNTANIEISYLKFTGTTIGYSDTYAGRALIQSNPSATASGNNDNFHIHHNRFEDFSICAISGTFKQGHIYNNWITSVVGEHCIYIANVNNNDIWIEDNFLIGPSHASSSASGIKLSNGDGYTTTNVHIIGNTFDLWRHSSIHLASFVGVLGGNKIQKTYIERNHFVSTTAGGSGNHIQCDRNPNTPFDLTQQIFIRHNYILNADYHGISTSCPYTFIENNIIKGCAQKGIDVDNDGNNAHDITIKGNYLMGNVTGGIRVYNPDDNLWIEGNFVDGSGAYIGIAVSGGSNVNGLVSNNISVTYNTPISIGAYPAFGNVTTVGGLPTVNRKLSKTTMTGNLTFTAFGGNLFMLDPNGENRSFDPSGTFVNGHEIVVMNLADADETIQIDSTGIDVMLGRYQFGIFIYDGAGATWRTLSVGNSFGYTHRVRSQTMTDNVSFNKNDGSMWFLDPAGAPRYLNPTGTFTDGQEIILVNLADAAETITFDSLGIAAAVAQNQRGWFVYDLTNTIWRKIYIGS